MRPARIIESFPITMTAGLLLGLLLGGFPVLTKEISMASLAVAMTLSLTSVTLAQTRGRDHFSHATRALVINYGFLTALILAIALFFEDDVRNGWILMAAAPSAISVVPFTTILGGQTSKALFSTAVNYIVALGLMPALTLVLIGSAVDVTSLIIYILLLIVLPMALSRAVMRMRISKPVNTSMLNISMAVLIFAVAGANRAAFQGELIIVGAISAACVVRTFGSGLLTEAVLRRAKIPKTARVSYVLFSSYKNLGLTATLAIALFEPIVAVPATICIVFEVVWVVFLIRFYPRFPE
jgi:BASS family bile acid:Na+ symporter